MINLLIIIILLFNNMENNIKSELNLNIKKRFFNEKYFPYLNCQCPLQIFYGGASSGKSVFLSQRRVISIIQEPRNFLIVRKVADTIRTSVFSETEKAIYSLQLQDYFNINKSTMEIEYIIDGRKMIFCGLDNMEKRKSITVPVGVITDIEIEEATEITEEDFEQLELRKRGKSPCMKRMILIFNPIFKNHWIMKRFFDKKWITYKYKKNEILIIHSTYKDNKFLDEQDKKVIESKTGYFHDVYAKGKPGILGDLIFTNWKINNCKDINFNITVYGLDFGFSADPSAVIKVGVDKSKKVLYIQEEIYIHGATNDVLAVKAKKLVGDRQVYCDCAEPKSIAELHLQGENSIYALPCVKGKDSVWHSIQWLQQWEIIIDPNCKNFIDEISAFQWQKNKNGETINEPNIHCANHLIDALRYATENLRLGSGISIAS